MTTPTTDAELRERARRLGLYGLLAHWEEFATEPWLSTIFDREETERARRSLERRIRQARLGALKPLADFNWQWPESIDRQAVTDLFSLQFISEAAKVVLVGPNGVGKTMIAQNLAHHAVMGGYTAKFTTASAMLNDLAAQDGARALEQRFRHYCLPQLLVIDEVGYLSYDNRHADLLFEVINRRYQRVPVVITTNLEFQNWNQVFPNAACVVTLIDRLVHRSEIIPIAGKSYRAKEADERSVTRKRGRKKKETDE